jgi:hypothetical protein
MTPIDEHVYGPWALVSGASSGVGEECARQDGGLPYMANESATKAYPLNLGEALHVELRQAGVNVTVLLPVLVNTPVVARIGLDKMGCRPSPSRPSRPSTRHSPRSWPIR